VCRNCMNPPPTAEYLRLEYEQSGRNGER
jgi:hypothetical protein